MRNRAELALETSAFGVWEYDPVAKRTKWDPRCTSCSAHRPSAGELQLPLAQPRSPQRPATEGSCNGNVRCRPGTACRKTYRIRLPNGRLRVLRSIGSVLPESLGGIIIGLNWDVTEETRLQDELRQARALPTLTTPSSRKPTATFATPRCMTS